MKRSVDNLPISSTLYSETVRTIKDANFRFETLSVFPKKLLGERKNL